MPLTINRSCLLHVFGRWNFNNLEIKYYTPHVYVTFALYLNIEFTVKVF